MQKWQLFKKGGDCVPKTLGVAPVTEQIPSLIVPKKEKKST